MKIILDDDETLNFSVSGIPTDPNTLYNLHEHANLISYVGPDGVSVSDALPDNMENFVEGIIGEGVAASPDPTLGWIGSLNSFSTGKGYWLKIDPDITSLDLIWNLDGRQTSNDDLDEHIFNFITEPFVNSIDFKESKRLIYTGLAEEYEQVSSANSK